MEGFHFPFTDEGFGEGANGGDGPSPRGTAAARADREARGEEVGQGDGDVEGLCRGHRNGHLLPKVGYGRGVDFELLSCDVDILPHQRRVNTGGGFRPGGFFEY